MTRFHYITLPFTDIAPLLEHALLHPPDAYAAEDGPSRALVDTLQKGYRWIRTDGDHAIFEKTLIPAIDHFRAAHPETTLPSA